MAGIEQALALAELSPEALGHVFHGTTVATNLILESKGAEGGAAHHRGLQARARDRPARHPAQGQHVLVVKPKRPVPPERIHEVAGRLDPDGKEILPLDEARVPRARRARSRPTASMRSRSASSTPTPTRRTSGARARSCARACRTRWSRCRRMCCRSSANTSAAWRRSSTSTSCPRSRPTSRSWKGAWRSGRAAPLLLMKSSAASPAPSRAARAGADRAVRPRRRRRWAPSSSASAPASTT